MRFKDFLREARHRQDISVEKAEELLKANCSDMDIKKPFWRGSRNASEECYIIQGDAGSRSSANTSNHYTVLMDEFLPAKGFPKRSASIILANYLGEGYARGYSTSEKTGVRGLYAIFPYNDVPIGVCSEEDVWHVRTEIGKGTNPRTLEKWNNWLENHGIPDYSYEDLVQGIKDGLEEDDDGSGITGTLDKVFDAPSSVESDLKQAFTPPVLGVKLCKSSTVPNDKSRELWIGGKCVAIRRDIWVEMLKRDGHDEPQEQR